MPESRLSPAGTFTGQLLRQVRTRPDHPAVIYTEDPGAAGAEVRLSYRRLHDAASALAARLRAAYPAGARLLLCCPPGPDFVIAFVACQYAGLVAVPAPGPDGNTYRRQRLLGIARDSGSLAVLTDGRSADAVRAWTDAAGIDLPAITPPADHGAAPADRITIRSRPEALSFLQYTSGSTGVPRGSMISQRNLARHCRMFRSMLGVTGAVPIGGWLPLFHDMGLIGHVITPLFCGGTSVLMPPAVFLRRPVAWLRLVQHYGLHMSAAPNFAYEMCTARVSDEELRDLDLSRWVVAINGSEPVQARTVTAFIDRFAPAGLRPETVCPGYGLAEATLAVSLSRADRPPAITPVDPGAVAHHTLRPTAAVPPGAAAGGPAPTRQLVGNGPVSGLDVRIVDPHTRAVRPAGAVGEIWVRGHTVAEGYWAQPEATRETFAAVTADGEPGFLRTGDLGTFHGDELYLTGRIKEVLVVSARNLYPQDIEAEARTCHPGLTGLVGAAFTVPAPQEEAVLVHEWRAGAERADPEAVAGRLQLHLSRAFGVAVSVVLVPPRTVPRTTSGKVRRADTRGLFLDGALAPAAIRLTVPLARAAAGARYLDPAPARPPGDAAA
ncbi:fatty acyl-AMP ligase [Jidongwangia harbinensis]|uniref:fatty acyl-AMP ligase n=1 Tax=Jidongwangia harbinensis TaxID=2878561 RepID=UPI001CD97FB7|nr:fatty acyl-AMP ligase [Jidongwangia harbinensis]MCA2211349.1 fatty acyl-AMP ligase [Jidongwangia harbinensis]